MGGNMDEMRITDFIGRLSQIEQQEETNTTKSKSNIAALRQEAKKHGINRDTCFFGCIGYLENFSSYCYLNKPYSECPCEEYISRNTFSSLVCKHNPNKELVDDILSEWDIFDPWELKDLTPEKQKKLLNILELIYEEDEE